MNVYRKDKEKEGTNYASYSLIIVDFASNAIVYVDISFIFTCTVFHSKTHSLFAVAGLIFTSIF
jgi:hypothetical protein